MVRRIFLGAGLYGLLVLLPLLLLGDVAAGRLAPPASNRPEQYYGFVGVALAWQLAFIAIARDPRRLRPLMPAAVVEKWLSGGLVLGLYLFGRIDGMTLAPFVVDLVLGGLFAWAWWRTPA